MKGFFSYYKPYRALFMVDFGCALFISLLNLSVPGFTRSLIDDVLPQKDKSLLIKFTIILLLVYLLKTMLQYIVDYYGHMLGTKIERDMRARLFKHIQSLPMTFFDNFKVGRLMSALVYDLNEISEIAHHGPEEFFMSVVLFIGAFFFMFQANVLLASVLLILLPIMTYAFVILKSKNKKGFNRLREHVADINARSQNSFSGVKTIKAFANEAYENEVFESGNEAFTQAKSNAYKTSAYVSATTSGFNNLINLIVFSLGGYLIYLNQMQVGELVAFLLYVQLFLAPINRISAFLMNYNRAVVGYQNYLDMLAIPSQQDQGYLTFSDTTHTNENEIFLKGDIEMKDISFSYTEGAPTILKQVSFSIPSKKTVALVGPSGSGKTTLCSLIPRFYELNEGSITIDGHDIKDIKLSSLRHEVGIVQQDIFIFAGTIKDNLLYGKYDATEEEMIEACIKADAHTFISSLENGYDTPIGERGAKLSGGQKQRIAIARVFLKNPKILILDEATSALDNKTEKLIQGALQELAHNRTTLIVAHRLSTVKHADEIIYFNETGIVERGTHTQLMGLKGHYYHLHEATLKPQI